MTLRYLQVSSTNEVDRQSRAYAHKIAQADAGNACEANRDARARACASVCVYRVTD